MSVGDVGECVSACDVGESVGDVGESVGECG